MCCFLFRVSNSQLSFSCKVGNNKYQKCDTKTEINTHTHTHTHTHKHKPPDNMDSGKEDKAISLKEEVKFVKEGDTLR